MIPFAMIPFVLAIWSFLRPSSLVIWKVIIPAQPGRPFECSEIQGAVK
jgi:hypothetical protein